MTAADHSRSVRMGLAAGLQNSFLHKNAIHIECYCTAKRLIILFYYNIAIIALKCSLLLFSANKANNNNV